MITAELLHSATKAFLNAHIENPRRNAEILLSYLLDCSMGEIYLNKKPELDTERFNFSIQQKIGGEPWAYIFNSVQFRDLELKIKKGVFIPRPETEILVEETIKKIKNHLLVSSYPCALAGTGGHRQIKNILDIGTGCGNIAISLAKDFPSTSILATDISKTALKIASINAQRYNLKNIRFLYSDLFKNIPAQKFELIVSNPPYIPSGDLKTLPDEVRKEPRSALDGGKKGISLLLKIIKYAPYFLKKGGYLILEIGICQDNLLEKIIAQPKLKLTEVVKDYRGIPRVMILKITNHQDTITK